MLLGCNFVSWFYLSFTPSRVSEGCRLAKVSLCGFIFLKVSLYKGIYYLFLSFCDLGLVSRRCGGFVLYSFSLRGVTSLWSVDGFCLGRRRSVLRSRVPLWCFPQSDFKVFLGPLACSFPLVPWCWCFDWFCLSLLLAAPVSFLP